MNEVQNLVLDIADKKIEIANMRLDQILKDKITIAVDNARAEVANKIFNSKQES